MITLFFNANRIQITRNVLALKSLTAHMSTLYQTLKSEVVNKKESFSLGRDYSTVDGRSRRKCYWTRASCDCGKLQICDVTWEVEFLSNDYSNPNTNSKTLTSLALTLADHHDAFESFCAPVFCDVVRNPGGPIYALLTDLECSSQKTI